MRTPLRAVLAISGLLLACDSSSPSPPLDIQGMWSFASTISNSSIQTTCDASGTIVVAQDTSRFSGRYSNGVTCSHPGGFTNAPANGSLSEGSINGKFLTFLDDAGCAYSGVASGSPANRMKGTLRCTEAVQGASYQFSGTWTASR
jgi:hypothetical protein